MSTSISINEHPTLDDDQQRTVLEIVTAATRTDGSAPLDEHSLIALRHHDPAVGHVLAVRAGSTVGYAIVEHDSDGAQAEMVVHPDQRQLGIGTALLQALPASVQIWAHGNIPAAQTIAAREGFTAVRTLWQLHRPLTGFETPQPPDGITIRGFRPGVDDEPWLAINAAAFAHHPEQGSWSAKDLLDRQHEPWFDPAGFLIAEVTAPQLGQLTAGDLAGFHWTKVHDGGTAEAVGEVYVVGVDPRAQGLGLGQILTIAGLAHLQDAGLDRVILYVDDDNTAAMRLYERLGFTPYQSHVRYARG